MGEGNVRPIEGNETTGTGNRTSSESSSSTDTRSGGNGGTGGTGGTATGNEKEKVIPQLAVVGEELTDEQKRLERNRKRRERYANQKAESGQTVKPRKVNKGQAKTPTAQTMTAEQMNKLIVSTSLVIASKPNCSHWAITEAEANTITTPLLAMIAESEKLEFVTKNSNQIALVIACFTVFVPRLFVTVQMNKLNKPKKEIKKHDITTRKTQHAETETVKSDSVNNGTVTDNSTDDGFLLSWDD